MPTPNTPSNPRDPSDNSVPHAIGQFVGHIWRGVRADTSSSGRAREVGRRTEEKDVVGADGQRITLRRTTIDEIEINTDATTRGDEPHGAS